MLRVSVSADRAYLPHVAAMLHSAVTTEHQPVIEAHLLHSTDARPEDIAPLAAMLEEHGSRLRPHRIDPARLAHLATHRFSITAWYRVLLPELLPDMDRVIHIDGDALVHKSLSELDDVDLEGSPFAAVANPLYPWMQPAWQRLDLAPGTPYLNTGVLLLDLAALRAQSAVDRLLAYGAAHPDNPWPEQDAFTAVFADAWKPLHPRWNVQATIAELPAKHLPWTRELVREARRDPGILHFSGPLKPWHGWGSPEVVRAYLAHRRAAGYPLAADPSRPPLARALPHLPLRLRRRVMLRAVRQREQQP